MKVHKPGRDITILVSQSMIKDHRRYLKKELCGVVLESKYLKKDYPRNADDSHAKKLGRYFEYILTGSTGRDDIRPDPEWTKSGEKKDRQLRTEEDMTAPYQLAHKNARQVKAYFKLMKIKIIEVNIHYERGGLEGTIDIIAMYRGVRVVIDVKYSGLIHNKWDELGWQMADHQLVFHGVQAHQYHYLASGIPFFFLVVSNENEDDILFLEMEFNDFGREQHLVEVDKTRLAMDVGRDHGFTPHPELVRCKKCAIAANCQFRMDFPIPKKIKLQVS